MWYILVPLYMSQPKKAGGVSDVTTWMNRTDRMWGKIRLMDVPVYVKFKNRHNSPPG